MQDKSWLKLIPQQEMIEWRRHFHEYPELSFKEFKTSAYISQILQSFGGIEISHPTPTSVLGTIEEANILVRKSFCGLILMLCPLPKKQT